MAQASSVQREPSMEEILASIRRIIEDSDGVRKPSEEPASRFGMDDAAAGPVAEVETFRAELGPIVTGSTNEREAPVAAEVLTPAVRSHAPAQLTELAPRPFRLAEVQAQVTREAATQPKLAQADKKPVTLADVQREIAKDAATARPAAAAAQSVKAFEPTVPQTKPDVFARAAPVQPAVEAKIENSVQKIMAAKPAEPVALNRGHDDEPVSLANVVMTRLEMAAKPIISPMASRQVAAAFGELSEAFAARSKKTFDELAEQMLRPMLQEWLDNNLPLLVERLVREEIERVARGTQ